MRVVQRVLQKLEERPPWLSWLAAAPFAVREAERLARRAYLVYQLPCAAVVCGLYAGARQLGWLSSHPLVGAWLLLLGFAALAWPVYIVRLAFAAYRNAGASAGTIASRLRILAVVALALAVLLGTVLAGLVALLTVVTVASPLQALP
jgi:hypothetical protein